MTKQKSIKLISATLLLSLTLLLPSVLASSNDVPPGIYSVTITLADIPPGFPPEAADILVGTWTVEFGEHGDSYVSKDGELVVLAKYSSSKSHLVTTDIEGPLACTDAPGIRTGVYNWSVLNNELTLSAVLDRCFGRMFVLTLRPLQRL